MHCFSIDLFPNLLRVNLLVQDNTTLIQVQFKVKPRSALTRVWSVIYVIEHKS